MTSCSGGLQQLKKGNFDEPICTSTNRLKQKTDNPKALSVLCEAYSLAINDHKRATSMFENSQEPFRWEKLWRNIKP
jgi:hypothetical protein